MAMMRIGILGGSFDPVHFAHLLLAETCREQCRLDEVHFLPAAAPPHKMHRTLTAASHRLAMLHLAVAGHQAFRISPLEIERGGVSFTFESLRELTRRHPDATLFFLMGADSLRDLPMWREPAEICRLAIPVVVRRAGAPEPDLAVLRDIASPERLEEIRENQDEMPVVDFSSTAIRRAVGAGRSIRYQTPRAVEKYIETNGLYRHQESG
jgi:nicotinate-nucleotide adenylyltransferase